MKIIADTFLKPSIILIIKTQQPMKYSKLFTQNIRKQLKETEFNHKGHFIA